MAWFLLNPVSFLRVWGGTHPLRPQFAPSAPTPRPEDLVSAQPICRLEQQLLPHLIDGETETQECRAQSKVP